MLRSFRRLALGLFLIATACSVLLLSDRRSRVNHQPARSTNPNPAGKKWKIAYILYNETPPAAETLAGMEAAWQRSALVAGRDYEITLRSSQADLGTLNEIIDTALTEGADIIVPMSTTTLQLAIQKVKHVPIVFTLVANPMIAGAGQSYTDHLPNVTGITVLSPFAEALDAVQKHFPHYRRIGTLFCPAEANSIDSKEVLEVECQRRGLTLELVPSNGAFDLNDASLSLCSRPIDAVLQISDNLTSSGFAAITRAARQARMPLLSLNSTTIPLGAAFCFGRDYHDAGEATVALLERVIRGENPGQIPFELSPKIIKAYGIANAKALGMTLPPSLIAEIDAESKKESAIAGTRR